MKPLLRLLAVSTLLLTALSSYAADAFEGKISLAISGEKKGRSQAMDYAIKGQKLRMDMNAEGNQVATIMDMEKMEMIMLMSDQKMYMVHSIKKPAEQVAEKAAQSNAEIEVTGKTEMILGYKCSQVLIKDKGTVTECWLAEGLAAFQGLGSPGGGGGMFGGKKSANAAKWEEALKGKGGFPLRVISHDAKGKDIYKMEATKIEPGPLPDSLFVPPGPAMKSSRCPSLGRLAEGFGAVISGPPSRRHLAFLAVGVTDPGGFVLLPLRQGCNKRPGLERPAFFVETTESILTDCRSSPAPQPSSSSYGRPYRRGPSQPSPAGPRGRCCPTRNARRKARWRSARPSAPHRAGP